MKNSRSLTNLFNLLKPYLKGLSSELQEEICQMCARYRNGTSPEVRNDFRLIRKDLKSLRKRLSAIQTAVGKLTATVEAEIDGVRSARRPRFAQIPILGKKGSLYYFQKNRLEDPAQGLVDFANALKCADNYLEGEVLWIDNRVPLVKAGWKERPDIFLSKGGFTTELEDSFRSANLGMKEVHRRIERILYKLEGRSITIDPDSGQSSAIRQARRRKPESRQNYSEPKP